jgi:hypothetical protein
VSYNKGLDMGPDNKKEKSGMDRTVRMDHARVVNNPE